MALDVVRARQHLKNFDFKKLFIEELGWDHVQMQPLSVDVGEVTYHLRPLVQKRGLVTFFCEPDSQGRIPDYPTRRKIERHAAKSVREHLIIYCDAAGTTQTWQWVKRELGKAVACREHTYHRDQPGESLVQKLQAIAFDLDDEEKLLAACQVDERLARGFYAEKVTKRFYDLFKAEHDRFLRFIQGIPDDELQRWYVSVMLNRLMFIYFIQKKGFLGGDQNYLRNKLMESRFRGRDRFYQEVLCPLFFEGFAKKETDRSPAMNQLLGQVPYLNGGIFMRHQVEELHGRTISIPDSAFEKIFDFFDAYHWHLDERPLRADNEINPDVLGYIFEKYINQKQMGAYYTKEDITEYIAKNTIIPFLFDAAEKKCAIAFKEDSAVWRLLRDDPDRYIYEPVRRGVDLELPEEIAVGVTDVARRGEWNKPAASEYALPRETWREQVARRQRCQEVRAKLRVGEIHSINDLITYNLDLCQFAEDVIGNSEGPELLRAFYHAIEKVTVLDPTCGSGAFLFAALNILKPLYDACLDRMQVFWEELQSSGEKHHPEKFSDFKKTLHRVQEHPNHRYFILKSIIINNLYGVDIMHEAVEICKLRLFLKLVAQVEPGQKIEPLPDIDFNIRAGNTLVGFANLEEVRQALVDVRTRQGRFAFGEEQDALDRITVKAADVQQLADMFREKQIDYEGAVPAADKDRLQQELKKLAEELDRFLAVLYGISPKGIKNTKEYEGLFKKWRASHQPFHWFSEFYGIIKNGGFDVIIGNPPYLEFREVDYIPQAFRMNSTSAIHAMCIDRSSYILHPNGCMSMILPMSIVSTQRMEIVQNILEANRNSWYANFAWRPAKLFDTVNRALTIFVVTPTRDARTFSTNYQKWTADTRSELMPLIKYVIVSRTRDACWVPKLGNPIELSLLNKCTAVKGRINNFIHNRSQYYVYYRTTGGLYWKVFTDFIPAFKINGRPGQSSRQTSFSVTRSEFIRPIIATLSSDLYWWWYTISSNLRDLNPFDLNNFHLPESVLEDKKLQELGGKYLLDLKDNSSFLVRNQRQTGRTETQMFKIQKSKPIIEEIDRLLAKHYGFTDEELDFIINYDIKYRMGPEAEGETGAGADGN